MTKDAYRAWQFLRDHPKRGWADSGFLDVLDVQMVLVNPWTGQIDTDTSKNTRVEVWLESGCGYTNPTDVFGPVPYHDPSLDCSGRTFEEAIIYLADLVQKHYG